MQETENKIPSLSVIMPCLNEENTVGICIGEALTFMKNQRISGEVIVVDNGSSDLSAEVAVQHGAFVITEPEKGYGSAIRAGLAAARGSVLIIGDCDSTYDFLHMEEIYAPLERGECDMVIGNRYAGEMEQGAMSFSHRWGVRFLSFLARRRFHTDVYDFHCGLRGMTKTAADTLRLHTDGMEFATEMIAEAARKHLRILQVPVSLKMCKYQRNSKLRTVRDGVRHLRYIITSGRRKSFPEKEK